MAEGALGRVRAALVRVDATVTRDLEAALAEARAEGARDGRSEVERLHRLILAALLSTAPNGSVRVPASWLMKSPEMEVSSWVGPATGDHLFKLRLPSPPARAEGPTP